MENRKVSIEEANFASLKRHAESVLNLEVPRGTNANGLRGKILAVAPETREVELVDDAGRTTPVAKSEPVAASKARYSINHPGADPKVRMVIHKTDDVTRAKEVTVSVNGFVWRMQRGVEIDVPYRAYLALNDAVEKRAVPQDEDGPFGLPKYEYQEVKSYPFQIIAMPSADEIDAWHKATCGHALDEAA